MSKKSNKVVTEPTLAEQAVAQQQSKDLATAKAMGGTVAGEIWDEIKEKPIEMFALPDQQVFMHVHPVTVEPSKLYLRLNSSAVLPSLEAALGKKYVVELVDRWVTVSRTPTPLTQK